MILHIKNLSIILLCITLSVCLIILTPILRETLFKGQEVAVEAKRAATKVADYAKFQTEKFESDAYQKSLKASIDAPAIFNASGRYINRFILPEILKTTKTSNRTLETANATIARLDDLIRHSDLTINSTDGLIPALTTLVASFNTLTEKTGLTIAEVNQAVKQASDKLGLSLDAFYSLMSDPAWLKTLQNVEIATAGVATTTTNTGTASKELPSITKLAKISLVAGILAAIAGAFLK